MRKDEFLSRLRSCLSTLPNAERENILEFYAEQIDERIDDGMNEKEAVASLEAPEEIAANVLIAFNQTIEDTAVSADTSHNRSWKDFFKSYKLLVLIILIITAFIWVPLLGGLALAAGSLWIAALAILGSFILVTFAGFLISVGFCASGIALMGVPGGVGISQLGMGIFALGLTILLILLSFYLIKYFLIANKHLIIFCKNLFIKKPAKKVPVQTTKVQNGPQKPKNYDALPLPDFDQTSNKSAKRFFAHPVLYSVYLTVIFTFTGAVMAAVPVLQAGGPYQLAEISGYKHINLNKSFDLSEVNSLDLSNIVYSSRYSINNLSFVSSPDDKLHIRSEGTDDKTFDLDLNNGILIPKFKHNEDFHIFSNIYHIWAEEYDKSSPYDVKWTIELPETWIGEVVLPHGYINLDNLHSAASFRSSTTLIRMYIKDSKIGGSIKVASENISMINSHVTGAVEVTNLKDSWSAQLYNSSAESFDLHGNGIASFADIETKSLKIKLLSGSVFGTLSGSKDDYTLHAHAACASDHLAYLKNQTHESSTQIDSELKKYMLPYDDKKEARTPNSRHWHNIDDVMKKLNSEGRLEFYHDLEPEGLYLRFTYTAKHIAQNEDQFNAEALKFIQAGLKLNDNNTLDKSFEIHEGAELKDAQIDITTENGVVQLGFMQDDEVWGYRNPLKGASMLYKAITSGYQDPSYTYNAVARPYIINLNQDFEINRD